MDLHATDDSIRLIIAIPPRQNYGGNDRPNALSVVDSLRPVFPHIFLFDCDTYLDGSEADFGALMSAARKFRPNVGLALPNAWYGMLLDKRPSYHKKTLRNLLTRRTVPPPGNIFADELGVPLIMLWDHLITQAQFLTKYELVPRIMSRPGCLEKLRNGFSCEQFLHYVPDSGHIEIFERLGICKPGLLNRYVVPSQNVFLTGPSRPPDPLVKDRILFAGNLSSDRVLSAFPNDDVVKEIRDFVIDVKCKEWGTAAWRAFEDIASQKVAAGVAELHPDHSFFWSLGRELITFDVLTAFRTTVFKALAAPVDFYGGFIDPEYVASLSRSGLFNAMGSVPFAELGDVYSRYQFSIDITHTPFIHGSNAKVLNCFGAGGFMFVDRKEDLRQALGEIADEFMYSNAEELTLKMEGLRRNPTRRLEIIQTVRERLFRDLNFVTLLSNTIHEAANNTRVPYHVVQ